jgi:hypothetical protein
MGPSLTEAVMGLSNAERQRRYIERLKSRAKAGERADGLKARCAALEREIAALKAELAGARKRRKPRSSGGR